MCYISAVEESTTSKIHGYPLEHPFNKVRNGISDTLCYWGNIRVCVCVRAWVGGLYIHAFAVRTVTDTFGQNRIHIMLIVTSAWKI